MDVSIEERWQSFLANAVETGRYASASDVVTEGLRLVQQREAQIAELRNSLDAAVADDIWLTPEQVERRLGETMDGVFAAKTKG